jgi:hypothetical protein
VCACLDGGGPCAASPCPAAARTAYSRHAAAAPCARPHAWQLLVAMPPLSCRTHAARCCTALQPALLLAPASGTPPILAAHRPALLLTPRNCSLAVRTQRVWLIAVRRHSLSCLPPHRATLHLSCAPPHSPQQLSSSPRLPASALRSVGTVALFKHVFRALSPTLLLARRHSCLRRPSRRPTTHGTPDAAAAAQHPAGRGVSVPRIRHAFPQHSLTHHAKAAHAVLLLSLAFSPLLPLRLSPALSRVSRCPACKLIRGTPRRLSSEAA